ncbi:MAG: Uncharacterized protein CEN90_420 [Parcubacteria group bacterium Licking1014_17]|nr:MAG: Uncharacterized protein CEN90_420 [Parcubacteria group bacterium Licking1014_17]
MTLISPPPKKNSIPLIHSICDLYRKIYLVGLKIPKRDRLGICAKIESICLDLINLLISAAFESKDRKLSFLTIARVKTEILKRLVRLAHEIDVIKSVNYIELESQLQEISKMINGWIKYLK